MICLHLGQATRFPISLGGTLIVALQFEHDILIFSLGAVSTAGAERGSLAGKPAGCMVDAPGDSSVVEAEGF